VAENLPIRPALIDAPRVRKMAELLKGDAFFREWAKRQAETLELLRRAVVATLVRVWAAARSLAPGGVLAGGTLDEIDRIAGVPGFARAMCGAGWLEVGPRGVIFPHWAEHNPPEPGQAQNPARGPEVSGAFDTFWGSYPKKVGKGAALKVWKRIRPDGKLVAAILAAVEAQKTSEPWRRDNGKFIPHPATWLGQGRWEDETCRPAETPAHRAARNRAEAEARRAEKPAGVGELRDILARARLGKGAGRDEGEA